MRLSIATAADSLLGGGLIAYPTEGVFGLGCMPDYDTALMRLLAVEQRDPGTSQLVAPGFGNWEIVRLAVSMPRSSL